MKALVLNMASPSERLDTLKNISALARHCDHCTEVAGILLALFKAAAQAAGMSDMELRRLREEMTPENPTADELAFINRFLGELAGPEA